MAFFNATRIKYEREYMVRSYLKLRSLVSPKRFQQQKELCNISSSGNYLSSLPAVSGIEHALPFHAQVSDCRLFPKCRPGHLWLKQ